MVGKPAVEEKKANRTQARAPLAAPPMKEKKVSSAVCVEKQMNRAWSVSLMDICRLDTPLVKRIQTVNVPRLQRIGAGFLTLQYTMGC